MMNVTKKVALTTAIETLSANAEMTEVVEVLKNMVYALDKQALKASDTRAKKRSANTDKNAEIGNILRDALTEEPCSLTELIERAGLEISKQKAVACLKVVGVAARVEKRKAFYDTTCVIEE